MNAGDDEICEHILYAGISLPLARDGFQREEWQDGAPLSACFARNTFQRLYNRPQIRARA